MPRRPADWMVRSDDRILETIEEEGNMTPLALSKEGERPRLDITRNWAGQRCRELADHGLLVRLEKGLYGITDEGIAYLEADLDASTLDRDA
ncbi:MAG: hypothetical protein ACOCY1_06130 [Halovenus sp.]